MSQTIEIVLPLVRGASGGTLKGLWEVISRWRNSTRVGCIRVHAPRGLHLDVEALGVKCIRYEASGIEVALGRFSPEVAAGEGTVVFVPTARPVRVEGCGVLTAVRNVDPIQPSRYRGSLKWRLHRGSLLWQTLEACERATRILVVSGYVREVLVSKGFDRGRIDVVYHGAEAITDPESMPEVCQRIRGEFVFAAGSIVPYRGFEDVIRSVAMYNTSIRAKITLVIGGGGGLDRSYEGWVRGLPVVAGSDSATIWAGQLTPSEMRWCLSHASAVVQTSRAESFSIFQVEAMNEGAWIISCDQPPMPEILGGAADYYEIGDVRALEALLAKRMKASAAEVQERRERALRRGGEFSWRREADETLDALEATRRVWAGSR